MSKATLQIEDVAKYVANRTIAELKLVPDRGDSGGLVFDFTDGSELELSDYGQDCCESRHMHSDAQLADFVGAEIVGAEVREGPSTEGDWGEVQEVQFLNVLTTKGLIDAVTYNEHNGYYGGFRLLAILRERAEK